MHRTGHVRPIRREPVLVVMAVLLAGNVTWFTVNVSAPVGPPILGTVPLLAGLLLSTYSFFRAWKAPGLAPPAVRFWRMLTVSSVLTTLVVFSEIPALARTPNAVPPPYKLAIFVLAFVLVLSSLYRLPLGVHSGGERLRLMLDVAAVTIAAVLFAWYFSFNRLLGPPPADQILTGVVLSALAALVLFGVVKAMLYEGSAVDPVALRLFASAIAVDIAAILSVPLPVPPQVGVEPLLRSVVYLLFVAAAVRQRRVAGAPPRARRANRRPFSTLPYVAVAGVDALLLITMSRDATDVVVTVAAVIVTGLVVGRQLAAFHENERLLEELARQERRFRSLVQNAADAIIILSDVGVLSYVSPGVERITGMPAGYWLGRQGIPVHEDDLPMVIERFETVLASPDTPVSFDARVATATGAWHWVRSVLTNRLHDPAVGGVVANVSDINEARAYHEQLSHQASHDSLTDLANRSLLGEQLQLALRTGGDRISLALIDLDDFKTVNDTLGHPAGDALLIAVAERLRRSVRSQDLVARLGGDEFAVLFTHVAAAGAERIAEQLLTAVAEPLWIDGHELLIQASIGIADAGPDEDVDQLMRNADIALYEAKGAGKGRIAGYSPDALPKVRARAKATADLRHALAAAEFELHYQPIVSLPQTRIAGVEALLRWNDRERGTVAPMTFIPLAEETGLIVAIGRWVLHEACRQAAQWLADYPATAPVTISVNVSPRQLREPGFPDDVRAALAMTGLAPHRLVVEITESTVVEDGVAKAALRALNELGVRIALDDFGTGYSTLSLMEDCRVNQLKLDRSFLREGSAGPTAVAVARIADALGMEAVAEGVETARQAEDLYRLGYSLAQGYHFARPTDALGITTQLQGHDVPQRLS
jgi:diguanylate cyclase (GGDEF)-like protein/PAS domain S-box-containing protein